MTATVLTDQIFVIDADSVRETATAVNSECPITSGETAMFFVPTVAMSLRDLVKDSDSDADLVETVLRSGASFVTYTGKGNYIEVYIDKCIHVAAAQWCLFEIVKNNVFTRVKVVAAPSNKFFGEIVAYLVENRFINPEKTGDACIQMTLDKNVLREDKTASARALTLRDELAVESLTYMVVARISSQTLERLRDYTSEPVEIGGVFVAVDLKPIDGNQVATLKYPTNTETRGDVMQVLPPPAMFNWHTHPAVCYTGRVCNNWPSSNDIVYTTEMRRNNNIATFVISLEGVYSVQVLPRFAMYLDRVHAEYSDRARKCLDSVYRVLENFIRGVAHSPLLEDKHGIEKYLSFVNGITLGEGPPECRWSDPGTDLKMYNVQYKSWEDISRDGCFEVTHAGQRQFDITEDARYITGTLI